MKHILRLKIRKSRAWKQLTILVACIVFYIVVDLNHQVPTCNELDFFYDATRVPRIVHIIDIDYAVHQARLLAMPDYEYMLWTSSSIKTTMMEYFPQFSGPSYRIMFKYFALHLYGGIYMDSDYVPTEDIFQYLDPTRVTVTESHYRFFGTISTCLMSSPKGHKFWSLLFKELHLRDNIYTRTSPSFMSDSLRLSRIFLRQPDSVYVLPCENFNRLESEESPKSMAQHLKLFFVSNSIFTKKCGLARDPCLLGGRKIKAD
jgi:hypothetical protein